jgi:hypothetical protein
MVRVVLAAVVLVAGLGVGRPRPAAAGIILGCEQVWTTKPSHDSGFVEAAGYVTDCDANADRWIEAELWQKVGGTWTEIASAFQFAEDATGAVSYPQWHFATADKHCGAHSGAEHDYKSKIIVGDDNGPFYSEFSAVETFHRNCNNPA